MKVLIVKPSSIGDIVHALPVATALKRQDPAISIHWLVNTEFAPLLQCCPDIDVVHHFDRKKLSKISNWKTALQMLRKLRNEQFDVVVDLQGLLRSSLITLFSGGKLRMGLSDAREGAALFYQKQISVPPQPVHAMDRYRKVLSFLKCTDDQMLYRWDIPEEIRNRVSKWLPAAANRLRFIFCADSRWETKKWPEDSFIELGESLLEKHGCQIILMAGDEASIPKLSRWASVQETNKVLNLAGKTSLIEALEVIRRSDCVVSNDTGLMHMAVALSKSLIAIYGPTSPLRTGPYLNTSGPKPIVLQKQLDCVPCLKDFCRNAEYMACMKSVAVHDVLKAVNEMLQVRPS